MKKILFCGDSHILAFENCKFTNTSICVQNFDAASAIGLTKTNSKLNTGKKISDLIETSKPDYLFFQFGKVDMDFVYPYRINRGENLSFEDQIEESTNSIIHFLSQTSLNTRCITVLGINLPTLESESMLKVLQKEGTIRNVSRKSNLSDCKEFQSVVPSLQTRTKYTLLFNKVLKEKAESNGFHYLDLINKTYSTERKAIKQEYINNLEELDHHLDRTKAREAWLKIITPLIHETDQS